MYSFKLFSDGRAPGKKERRSSSRSLQENGAALPLPLLYYKRNSLQLPLQHEKSALVLALLSEKLNNNGLYNYS